MITASQGPSTVSCTSRASTSVPRPVAAGRRAPEPLQLGPKGADRLRSPRSCGQVHPRAAPGGRRGRPSGSGGGPRLVEDVRLERLERSPRTTSTPGPMFADCSSATSASCASSAVVRVASGIQISCTRPPRPASLAREVQLEVGDGAVLVLPAGRRSGCPTGGSTARRGESSSLTTVVRSSTASGSVSCGRIRWERRSSSRFRLSRREATSEVDSAR